MNVQLIGGAGFIGGILRKQLQQYGHQVVVTDKRGVKANDSAFVQADVRSRNELDNALSPDTDWVVLLAAEHADNVSPTSLYYDVNVQGTANVLDVMRQKGINNILFTSTVAVYGLDKMNPAEDFPTEPENHYGKSKLEAEKLLVQWQNEAPDTRKLIIIRPTVVFGPGNRGNVYNLIKQVVSGKFLMIGNGENIKSMAYVENVAAFIRYSIENDSEGVQVFNYTDKPDLSTKKLIEIVHKSMGRAGSNFHIPYAVGFGIGMGFDLVSFISRKKLPISSYRIRKFCATTRFSSQKMLETGFSPLITLEEGIAATVASIRQEQGIPVREVNGHARAMK